MTLTLLHKLQLTYSGQLYEEIKECEKFILHKLVAHDQDYSYTTQINLFVMSNQFWKCNRNSNFFCTLFWFDLAVKCCTEFKVVGFKRFKRN